MRRVSGKHDFRLNKILSREEILSLQELVERVPVADHIFNYAARLVRGTRPTEADASAFVKQRIAYGAGPRASIYLIVAGKARAIMRGNYHVSIDDIKAVAPSILRHRLILNFSALSEGLTPDQVVHKLLDEMPVDEKLYSTK